MFESALVAALKGAATVTTYLGTYASSPAVFADEAPEGAEMTYLVIKINKSTDIENRAMSDFSVMIDYYDFEDSRANMKSCAQAIENLLDGAQLTHARFGTIRLFVFAGSEVYDEDDPRSQHYNMQFTARAARKAWMDNL